MSKKLHAKQLKAAHLAVLGYSAVESGRVLGVCAHTLSRWKKIPEFNMECERLIRKQHQEAHRHMSHQAATAVDEVWSGLHDRFNEKKRTKTALNMLKLLGIERI